MECFVIQSSVCSGKILRAHSPTTYLNLITPTISPGNQQYKSFHALHPCSCQYLEGANPRSYVNSECHSIQLNTFPNLTTSPITSQISIQLSMTQSPLWRRRWHPTPVLFCLENPMDRGAWWATVHGVAESRTRLSDFTCDFHFHALEKKVATHSSVLAWRIPGTGERGGLPSMGSHRVGHD